MKGYAAFANYTVKEDCIIDENTGWDVMSDWETPIMQLHADIVCASGGHILEFGFGMGIGMQGGAQLLGSGSQRAVEEMAASLLDDGIIEEMGKNRSAFEQAKKDFNKGAQLTLEEKLDAKLDKAEFYKVLTLLVALGGVVAAIVM